MVRQSPYVMDGKMYEHHYCSQAGHGLPVFIGGRNIRGGGLGSLFSGLARSLVPLVKSGGKALLKEGTRAGMQIAGDVLSGRQVGSAVKERAKQAGKRLIDRAFDQMRSPSSKHSGRKRIKSTASPRPRQKTSRTIRKKKPRRQIDIFG